MTGAELEQLGIDYARLHEWAPDVPGYDVHVSAMLITERMPPLKDIRAAALYCAAIESTAYSRQWHRRAREAKQRFRGLARLPPRWPPASEVASELATLNGCKSVHAILLVDQTGLWWVMGGAGLRWVMGGALENGPPEGVYSASMQLPGPRKGFKPREAAKTLIAEVRRRAGDP